MAHSKTNRRAIYHAARTAPHANGMALNASKAKKNSAPSSAERVASRKIPTPAMAASGTSADDMKNVDALYASHSGPGPSLMAQVAAATESTTKAGAEACAANSERRMEQKLDSWQERLDMLPEKYRADARALVKNIWAQSERLQGRWQGLKAASSAAAMDLSRGVKQARHDIELSVERARERFDKMAS